MKKYLMMFAAVLCCALTTTVLTSCGSDDEEVRDYTYSIGFTSFSYSSSSSFLSTDGSHSSSIDWPEEIMNAYEQALGVTKETFTFHGTESECNERVSDCCKKAEDKVKDIKGGTATIVVTNNTTGKTVYTYYIK